MKASKSKPELGLHWRSECKSLLSRDMFYVSKARSTGISNKCKPCSRAVALKWNRSNENRVKERARIYVRPPSSMARQKQWRAENKHKLNRYMTEWRHGDHRRSRCRRPVAWADVPAMRATYAEARRRTSETGIPHHVDHVIPLLGETVSGLHVHNNLRVVPAIENLRKSNSFEVHDQ